MLLRPELGAPYVIPVGVHEGGQGVPTSTVGPNIGDSVSKLLQCEQCDLHS